MKCNSCGCEWSVPDEIARTLTKCPFCQSDLQPKTYYVDDATPTKSAQVDSLVGLSIPKESIAKFYMPIEHVFNIKDRGTVVCGQLQLGSIHVGDPVDLVFPNGNIKSSVVIDIEFMRRSMPSADARDHIGVFLRDVTAEEAKHAIMISSEDATVFNHRFLGYVKMEYKNEKQLIDQSYTTIKFMYTESRGYLSEACGYFAFIGNDNKYPGMEKVSIEIPEKPIILLPDMNFTVFKADEEITKGIIDSIIE